MSEPFRDYSEYWTRLRGSHHLHPANRYRYWLIVRALRRHGLRFASVLDCGCGDGSLLTRVLQAFGAERAIGVDISPETIENLRKNGPAGVAFRVADLGKPLQGAEPVDLVLCSEVIEHVPDDGVLLDNLARLVVPGGHLVLTTQSGPIRRTENTLGHLRHYDLGELAARVEKAGFRVLEKRRRGWPLLNLQKALAERFYRSVTEKIMEQESVSLPMRAVFAAFYQGYKLCALGGGPQLLIVARREARA